MLPPFWWEFRGGPVAGDGSIGRSKDLPIEPSPTTVKRPAYRTVPDDLKKRQFNPLAPAIAPGRQLCYTIRAAKEKARTSRRKSNGTVIVSVNDVRQLRPSGRRSQSAG